MFKAIDASFQKNSYCHSCNFVVDILGKVSEHLLVETFIGKAFSKSKCLTLKRRCCDKHVINLAAVKFATGEKLFSCALFSSHPHTTIRDLYFVILHFLSRFHFKTNFVSKRCSSSGLSITFQQFIVSNAVFLHRWTRAISCRRFPSMPA